jgi:hypothetical protein
MRRNKRGGPMNISNFVGSLMITVAISIVGFSLYQQNERDFAESQRWLEVCKKQTGEELQRVVKQMENDNSIPKEAWDQAKRGIDAYDEDYLYSRCYKEWHAGE